jgi:hypothetical protein
MRRWLLTITVAFVLGAVVTYSVAWFCALWSPVRYTIAPNVGAPTAVSTDYWTHEQATGYRISHLYHTEMFGKVASARGRWPDPNVRLAGWPMFALRSSVSPINVPGRPEMNENGTRNKQWGGVQGWDLPVVELFHRGYPTNNLPDWLRAQPNRRLPLIPIWPGFAVNSLLFASLAWCFIALFLHVRAKHGSFTDLETCPECGTSANPRRMQA